MFHLSPEEKFAREQADRVIVSLQAEKDFDIKVVSCLIVIGRSFYDNNGFDAVDVDVVASIYSGYEIGHDAAEYAIARLYERGLLFSFQTPIGTVAYRWRFDALE